LFIYYASVLIWTRAGELEPERPEQHDLAGAILFFLQKPEWEPEQFKKLELSHSWSQS